MKPGVTLDQATADIKTITQRIVANHPEDTAGMSAVIVPLRELISGEVRQPLILLLVAVMMVLLIACANIASLLLSRATARRKEMAVRTALGASRFRIMRQLLTESIVLAFVGGALGLIVSSWSFSLLKQLIPEEMVAATTLKIDLPILAYSTVVSLVTGIVFGLAPALQLSKVNLNEALKLSTRTGTSAISQKLRGAFIVTQIALALVLLVGAGLLMQTVFNLRQQYSGFQPERLLTMRTILPGYKYGERYRRVAFYDAVLERVKAIPGVTAAGYTTSVPLQWKGGFASFTVEGQEPRSDSNAIHRQVSIDYLQAMGIGLREGRYFDQTDRQGSSPVAIVNETLARAYWPNESALGKRFKLDAKDAPWVTITGIVNDVRQMGMDAPVKAEMYFPYRQITTHAGYRPRDLVVRTTGDPIGVLEAVRQQIHAIDPDQPLSTIATMEHLLTQETGPRRLGTILLSAFAAFALVLASLGIYGGLSYFVTQQIPDIGVRMALGAQSKNIMRLILGKGMRLVLSGVFVGLAASFALTRLIAGLLFGVSATDPLTFVSIPLVLIGVALVACYLPARRATKVDPLVALRYE
jgi:predicted permease